MAALLHLIVFAVALQNQGARRPHAAEPCGDPVAFQVRLDRRGFSAGEIDGTLGDNAARALTAFQRAHGLPATGRADCATWKALDSPDAPEPLTTYRITDADARGPFTPEIPADLTEQAHLPALNYRNLTEELAERFHAAPQLLVALNRGRKLEPGETIRVPNVTPYVPVKTHPAAARPREVTIEVSRGTSSLRVTAADGTLVFDAPVSSGSEHDPLPLGRWHVTAVDWMPTFHYNPALFWDADPSHAQAIIKPGPNGPVGAVWIDINVPHYGLHGSGEPALIGHAQSHGCVRLTNWDAAKLAAMVRPGTPVIFKE
ncbi:MAG TPA: L,D-transpeptidase [Vicinamibacterales bacterium]